jgi:hypothetical protein
MRRFGNWRSGLGCGGAEWSYPYPRSNFSSEEGASNAEIKGSWQKGSQDPEVEGGRREGRENEKAPARKAVAAKKPLAAGAEAQAAVAGA